jgi:predicted nucleic acid-binding protein
MLTSRVTSPNRSPWSDYTRPHRLAQNLVEDGRKAGYAFSQPDPIIAATALHHGLTVVTRNVSDYERVRARVFNPWVDSLPASAS